MTDYTKLAFDSRVNYMKRDISTGQASMTLGAAGSTVTKIITPSDITYVPIMHVSFEPLGDGMIFPTERINKYTESASFSTDQTTTMQYWWDTAVNSLVIQLTNNSSVSGGSRMVYWVIYLDYGNM